MRTPPRNLDPDRLVEGLARDWAFEATALDYRPVGFGSHHWLATDAHGDRRFVTVDVLTSAGGTRDLHRELAACRTAYALRHDAGLDFVVAPLPAAGGQIATVLEPGFVVTVFHYLDGIAWPDEEDSTDADEQQVAQLLVRIHAATDRVVGVAAVDDLEVAERPQLEVRVGQLDQEWVDAGPYTDRARALLSENRAAVMAGLTRYDALADQAAQTRDAWVVTHGEPHSRNLLRMPDGPVLIDWDTALIAPAGRDVWMLGPAGEAHYAELLGHAVPPSQLDLYRLRWDLAEVAEYVRWFAEPHEGDEDSAIAWGGFVESLDNMAAQAPGG